MLRDDKVSLLQATKPSYDLVRDDRVEGFFYVQNVSGRIDGRRSVPPQLLFQSGHPLQDRFPRIVYALLLAANVEPKNAGNPSSPHQSARFDARWFSSVSEINLESTPDRPCSSWSPGFPA